MPRSRIRIAVTGHRPNKLGGYESEATKRLYSFALHTLSQYKVECPVIISGMALGWDMAIARAALRLNFDLVVAIPFKGQESMWPETSKAMYHSILKCAYRTKIVSVGGYASYKMQLRNQWMVDRLSQNTDMLIALHDGSEGGTANCIQYAKSKGVAVNNVYDEFKSFKD